MADRVCVLHIGTHKTGTTLLQHFLQWNTTALEQAGVLFPSTAWYGVIPGQHAAAWELMDAGIGSVTTALLSELRESDASHAIVSSEELSLLFARPERLAELVRHIREAGYTVKVLAYLRPQPAMVESMFAEQIKHGNVQPFGSFMETALESGSVPVHARRVTFRAGELLSPFAELVSDGNIRLHAYPVEGNEVAIIHDFLDALAHLIPGFSPAQLQLDVHRTRMNESLSFGHLLGRAFVSLFPDAGLPDDPEHFIAQHVPGLPRALFDARFSLLELDDYVRFLEVFGDDNRRVRERFGMSAQFLNEADIPSIEDPRWARAAIERPLLDACLTKWMNESRKTMVGTQQ